MQCISEWGEDFCIEVLVKCTYCIQVKASAGSVECGLIELPAVGEKAGGATYTGRCRLYCPGWQFAVCQRHLCCWAVIRTRTRSCGKFGFTDSLKPSYFCSDCKMVGRNIDTKDHSKINYFGRVFCVCIVISVPEKSVTL